MMSLEELDQLLTEPTQALIKDLEAIEGDIIILGVGGKMGPSLAKLAKRAVDEGGLSKKVIGVSRFSNDNLREELESAGIETIACDLLDDASLKELPDVKNVIYMAGTKFGTSGNEHYTWAMNAYLPGRIAEKFKDSRIVTFSSGNVYPLTNLVHGGGCSEEVPADPIGEYAQSCLGRERILTNFSYKNGTPVLIFRLNYAIDMRYGVLLEIAQQVYNETAIDLSMGAVNVIWQGDANSYALRSLNHCESPPKILNVTGPETISVRWLAEQFGKHFDKKPIFSQMEESSALLNTSAKAHKLFGYPTVTLQEMIEMTAEWVKGDGESYDKPTHFQEREGEF